MTAIHFTFVLGIWIATDLQFTTQGVVAAHGLE